eukprot:4625566-Pleurochrysis_carterae.AAC.1
METKADHTAATATAETARPAESTKPGGSAVLAAPGGARRSATEALDAATGARGVRRDSALQRRKGAGHKGAGGPWRKGGFRGGYAGRGEATDARRNGVRKGRQTHAEWESAGRHGGCRSQQRRQ